MSLTLKIISFSFAAVEMGAVPIHAAKGRNGNSEIRMTEKSRAIRKNVGDGYGDSVVRNDKSLQLIRGGGGGHHQMSSSSSSLSSPLGLGGAAAAAAATRRRKEEDEDDQNYSNALLDEGKSITVVLVKGTKGTKAKRLIYPISPHIY